MRNETYERYYLACLVTTLLLIAASVLVWVQEPARMAHAAEEINQESILRGRSLYVDNCTSCHGTRGEGGVGPALNSKALLEAATDEVLFASINAGRPGTTMPAWGQEHGGPLTHEDTQDVVNFLRAWEETAPEIAEEEFVPSASRGATLDRKSVV